MKKKIVAKKERPKINIKVAKVLSGLTPLKKSNKEQRYVKNDELRIKDMKAKGWKPVAKPVDVHGRELGVRVHSDDLILMEK